MAISKIIKVAYADDHLAVRKGIVSLIEDCGPIRVIIEASNGREILHKIADSEYMPDIIIIDLSMPVMNGIELIKEAKIRWPRIPSLILTAFYEEYLLLEAIKHGAKGYLLKSVEPQQISDAIQSICSYGYYHNEIYNGNSGIKLAAQYFTAPVFNDREIELLKYVCTDLSYADIAILMNTTFKTVDGIRMRLYSKLKITSRVGLALVAIRYGYYVISGETLVSQNTRK